MRKNGRGPRSSGKKETVSARKYEALRADFEQLEENNAGVQLALAAMIAKHGASTEEDGIHFVVAYLNIEDFKLVANSHLASETVTIEDEPQTKLIVKLKESTSG